MTGIVGKLGHELDPRNNLDALVAVGRDSEKYLSTMVRGYVKPLLRGGITGAAAGAGVAYLFGADPQFGAIVGGFYGGFVDALQYTIRGIHYRPGEANKIRKGIS